MYDSISHMHTGSLEGIVGEIMKMDSMQGSEAVHSQSVTCSLQLADPSTARANIVLIMRISIAIKGLET